MRIIYCHEPTENSHEAASVARLLAERVGDTVARLESGEDRDGRMHRRSPAAACSDSSDTSAARPDLPDGPETTVVATIASPACTRLIVAPSPAEGATLRAGETERLALSTRVPALVVHDPARLLAWLHGGRPLRVLCAHDLTTTADEALRFIRNLSRVGPCEVLVAHVHRSVEKLSHPGCGDVGSMRKHDLEMRGVLEARLQERARNILGDRLVGTRVSSAPFRRDDFILDLVRKTDVDLVVAATHQAPWSREFSPRSATSRMLLSHAATNIVIVPAALPPGSGPRRHIRRVLAVTSLAPADGRVVACGHALLGHGGTLRLLHVMDPLALPECERDCKLDARQRPAAPGRFHSHEFWRDDLRVVRGPRRGGPSENDTALAAARARLVESNSNRLRELARITADGSRIVFETEIMEHRDRAVAIAQAAERFDADIVCLAMPPQPTLFTRLFRCQIRRILARNNRPLMVVQPTPA